MATIEAIWEDLRTAYDAKLHRLVDDHHPLDIYAEFAPPAHPGLVLFCSNKPPEPREMRSLTLERGQRPDGKWWLRVSLREQSLQTVFSGLCQDIITFTRSGVSAETAPTAILARVERWRTLLEDDQGGLTDNQLRGMIGEILTLLDVLNQFPPLEAVSSWNGPLGAPQDFMLPDGKRIEVKTVRPDADSFRVNGIGQLDPGYDLMELHVIKLGNTVLDMDGALTLPQLIKCVKERIDGELMALNEFNSRLAAAGWYDYPKHDEFAVKVTDTHRFNVVDGFPRIIANDIRTSVHDVNYLVELAGALAFEIGRMRNDRG